MQLITFDEYQSEISRFFKRTFTRSDIEQIRTYLVLRFPVECPITPTELSLIKRKNIQEHEINGIKFATLFIDEGSKKVKRSGRVVPRYRSVVLSSTLYKILKRFLHLHRSDYIIPKFYKNPRKNAKRIFIRKEPLDRRSILAIHENATHRWNQHKVINGRIGGKHMFKMFIKKKCREAHIQYDEDVMRQLMGHRPRDSHGLYGSYTLDLETAFEMIEVTFGNGLNHVEDFQVLHTQRAVERLFSQMA